MDNLISHIEYRPDLNADYPWYYTVDFADADGKRDLDSASVDYGNVETATLAEKAIAETIAEYRANN
jgi:hypothetical protein